MTLPIIKSPLYQTTIPSTNEAITYRGFTVKEEKILLLALQNETMESLILASKQVINNCTFGSLNIEKLTSYDLDFLMLKLREVSKGSIVSLSFKCGNEIQDNIGGVPSGSHTCNNIIETQIDLSQVKVQKEPGYDTKILLTDTIGVVMREPSVNDIEALSKVFESKSIEEVYATVPKFIELVFDGPTVHKNYTQQEIQEFVESLNADQFSKIRDFFDKLPKLKLDVPIRCNKCGYTETVTLEGLQSFLV